MAISKRTNKKFDYKPRYYKTDKEGSPYEMGNRFDPYRKTIESTGGLKKRMTTAWDEFQESRYRFNKTIILIVAILLFVCLWIIDFDLSIFGQPIIDI